MTGRRFMRAPAAEAHERHMEAMKGLHTTAQRREYVEGVRRSEGRFYAEWLQADFGDWWAKGRKSNNEEQAA